MLILDLESIVEELGIYQPKMEVEVDEIHKFSGVALILDDSLTARRLVSDALTKMGLRVVEAKDGVEGLEKLEDLYSMYKNDLEQNLRVIISDVEMPQMDGFHFAANVRDDKRFANIPIIFNSSLSNEFSELHGKDAGGDVFLTKFNDTEFYKAVSRVIETRKKYIS